MSSSVEASIKTDNVIGEPSPKPEFEVVGPSKLTLPLPFVSETPALPKKKTGDVFWTDDVEVLWKGKRYMKFFPGEQDTYEEKLNAIMRASMYIMLVLMVLYMNISYVWVGLVGVVLTIFLYSQQIEKIKKEGFVGNPNTSSEFKAPAQKQVQYVEPTPDNPMMNVALTDYREKPNREALSKVTEANDPKMKHAIDGAFYDRIFRDVSDVYSTVAAERNFYTMPSTTIPNDQKAFAEFCYGTPPTCKEGNGYQCWENTNREDYLRGGSRPVQL